MAKKKEALSDEEFAKRYKELMKRLKEDGYIKQDVVDNAGFYDLLHNVHDYETIYQLTLNGVLFVSDGGYVAQNKRESRAACLDKMGVWIVVLGTGIGGIYALYLLLKEFF